MSEADARVPRGALHHGASRLEHATPLGVLNDVKRRAVLHRTARVHELGFAENLAAGLLAERREPDERRVADAADKTLLCAHECASLQMIGNRRLPYRKDRRPRRTSRRSIPL